MLDIKLLRSEPQKVIDAIKSRGGELDLTEFAEIDKQRRELLQEVEALKNKQNVVSKQIPQLKKEGKDVAVLTLGPIGNEATKAIASAEAKSGKTIAHYDLRFLKPLDEEMLDEIAQNYKFIVTIEDGVLKGGMGSAILEYMADHGYTPCVRRMGIPDSFVQHGTPKELYQICGMDATSIENVLLSF